MVIIMTDLQRFGYGKKTKHHFEDTYEVHGVYPNDDGDYVRYQDAMDRIKELEKELNYERGERQKVETALLSLSESLPKRDLEQQVKILCTLMDLYEVKVDAPVGYHAVVFVNEIEQLAYRLRKQSDGL